MTRVKYRAYWVRANHRAGLVMSARLHAVPPRDHMIIAWCLIMLGRGVFYFPGLPGSGDLPVALAKIIDERHQWIVAAVWVIIGAFGLLSLKWEWWEKPFWPGLLGIMAGWGGMYIAGAVTGTSPATWVGGELFLAVAYGMWASRGKRPPETIGAKSDGAD